MEQIFANGCSYTLPKKFITKLSINKGRLEIIFNLPNNATAVLIGEKDNLVSLKINEDTYKNISSIKACELLDKYN